MCGIFGFVGDIARETALTCTNMLAHRGPDGCGIWEGDGVTLGHRRLSILDLSEAGAQPMSFADGRYHITYNGEIYNFIEIRNELSDKGHRFVSDSDTEVLLAAFFEWGEKCLLKLNGMWSFAIWDGHERSLFICRDRFGKKPLFYSMLPSGLAFASEMKALFPLLSEVRPNIQLVKNATEMFKYESSENCLVEGIKRFPAGYSGWWKDGKLTKRRWWCTLDHLPDVPLRYEEQVEQFRELFLDACHLRMRSDVPIGTALSGGLDSSSTISAMSYISKHKMDGRISSNWQHAFVACFPGTPLDEKQYAQMVTSHLGIDVNFLDIDPLDGINHLSEYLYLFEELYITSPLPFMAIYEAMKRHGVKVTVDGHGADELFGGYSFDIVSALSDAALNPEKIRSVLDAYDGMSHQNSSQFRLKPRWYRWLQWHSGRVKDAIKANSTKYDYDELHPNWHRLDNLNKTLYRSTHETVLPTLLRNYDRYSMANGVEIRMPFMDHRVVGFAFAIPWDSKIRNGYSKSVVRDAMSMYMPHEVAYRKSKIGFNSPIVDWMQGPLKPFFLDTINSASFNDCVLIDPPSVAAKIKKVIFGHDVRFSLGEEAWTGLVPFLWEEAVIKRGTARCSASLSHGTEHNI
jgi:asparagine synthase (glutamine-hydrolysing)